MAARYFDKICQYLIDNGTTFAAVNATVENIKLQDDMVDGVSNPYIHTWNVDGIAKPSDSKLDEYTTAAENFAASQVVKYNRQVAYGNIADELDMLYKDIVAGKVNTTGTFALHVKKVKDDNPKS